MTQQEAFLDAATTLLHAVRTMSAELEEWARCADPDTLKRIIRQAAKACAPIMELYDALPEELHRQEVRP